jgi:predicted phage tail protein
MWIGTVTALYAALCAIVQSDIKKVLAYSTLSQLGYMVAAFGLGSLAMEHGEHQMLSPPAWAPRCSTSRRTPSSRPSCSSVRARSSTAATTSRTSSRWAA